MLYYSCYDFIPIIASSSLSSVTIITLNPIQTVISIITVPTVSTVTVMIITSLYTITVDITNSITCRPWHIFCRLFRKSKARRASAGWYLLRASRSRGIGWV